MSWLMRLFHFRLFFRIALRNREIYALKIVTLAIALACAMLIVLFSLHEFGFDRFHNRANAVFRVLQRNNSTTFSGNRLSNRIPPAVVTALKSLPTDSVVASRVKVMDEVDIHTGYRSFRNQKIHAADTPVTRIFSLDVVAGTAPGFSRERNAVMLSESAAVQYFGTSAAAGRLLKVSALGDTVAFLVTTVFRNHPDNAHERFSLFIRYDTTLIGKLHFDADDTGVYGRSVSGRPAHAAASLNRLVKGGDLVYLLQPLPEIYFGPRATGEDARHGDAYSVYILISIIALIIFLAMANLVNLTTLTLPYRSKELAIKKMAGDGQVQSLVAFAKESVVVVLIAALLAALLLAAASDLIVRSVGIDIMSLVRRYGAGFILIITVLLLVMSMAPLFMAFRFTQASPTRLMSTEAITFPRFKRIITSLQLGISIFLLVTSVMIRRQISYSLLKEPGRNHDQVVYMDYPAGLTAEGLRNIRKGWKDNHPNIVDVIALSALPSRINSMELNTGFYVMSVDAAYPEFFRLPMVKGSWFRPNDSDLVFVVNDKGSTLLPEGNVSHVKGVIQDLSAHFNQPQKPLKMKIPAHIDYHYLCIRILEVDIRRTVRFLSTYFEPGVPAPVMFLNRRFEAWLLYQDQLNALSDVLTVIAALLSCCAIYGLSISLVRDKAKQIALHKIFGATTPHLTALLVREFAKPMLTAVLVFGPLTYIFTHELLRNFVYHTHFTWLDPLIPLAYCGIVITLLCGFQAVGLNRASLSTALKG